jgi:hypothetical protein
MKCTSIVRIVRVTFAIALAALLVGGSAGVYAQRSSRRSAPRQSARQPSSTPYSSGYVKGYNDGFLQGGADWRASAPCDFKQSAAYQQRDRAYDQALASSADYRDGYDLGLELGYLDGYYGRVKNIKVPPNGILLATARRAEEQRRAAEGRAAAEQRDSRRESPDRDRGRGPEPSRPRQTSTPLYVQTDTELRLRLNTPMDTNKNKPGDSFTATVVLPPEYEGGSVVGHIASIKHSGRVSGRTELNLAFDEITLPDGRRGQLDGQLVRIYESENVKKVDDEGRIETGSRTKDSEVRGGAGAVVGAIIGGIVGGGKGAVAGAALGGAAGVGTVYVEGNKHLILEPGTEMLIRAAGSGRR